MGKETTYACYPSKWVELFSDEFFRFASYRVKNNEVAEDLVQDTFLSALKSMDKSRGDCPEKSWLYNILRKNYRSLSKKTNQELKHNTSVFEIDEDSFLSRFFNSEGKYTNHWTDDSSPGDWDISADTIIEKEEIMQFIMLCHF